MSNKQRLTIEVISKEEGMSLIKNTAEEAGPGLIMTEKGNSDFTNSIHEESFNASEIVNRDGNFDVVEPKVEPTMKAQPESRPTSSLKAKFKKSGIDLKNKGKIKAPQPKMR